MTKRTFSDEDLTLYLDKEASDALTREIDEAISQDEALSAQIEDMQAAKAAFVSDQEGLLSLAPPMPALPKPAMASYSWGPAMVGLAAGLAIAACASWSFLAKGDPDWRDVVATYQSLYVTETLSGVAEPQNVLDAKLTELSSVLGLDLTDLPPVEGLVYRRAQQLGYLGKPLAQLTFLTADGGPVALCILRTGGPTTKSIKTETLEGMAAYSWVEDGFGILLIGPQGDATLSNAATTFRETLQGKST